MAIPRWIPLLFLWSWTAGNIGVSAMTERDALMAFYNATTSNCMWTNSTGWGTDSDYCTDWFGVNCDASGTVIQLVLSDNGLCGTLLGLPLLSLPRLNTLDLSFNPGISGTLPPQWGDMLQLKELHLES